METNVVSVESSEERNETFINSKLNNKIFTQINILALLYYYIRISIFDSLVISIHRIDSQES